MWYYGTYIVAAHVVAVTTRGTKYRRGAVLSKGCDIHLTSGKVIKTRWPTTQVVAILGLTPLPE